MNWEDIMVELAKIKPDTVGWLFELACYPHLKTIFGEMENGSPLDFRVKGEPVFIEIKIRGWGLREEQIDFMMETQAEFYLVLLERYLTSGLRKLGSIEHKFETPLGTAVVLKIDLGAFRKRFEEDYKRRKQNTQEVVARELLRQEILKRSDSHS